MTWRKGLAPTRGNGRGRQPGKRGFSGSGSALSGRRRNADAGHEKPIVEPRTSVLAAGG